METYDHKKIEKKWQKKWADTGLYKATEDSSKKKLYVLDMFPYPSGEGLHVGHPRGYIATDIYARFSRMQGKSVLHPMGWDAFGLPAENFALKNKVHPRVAVEQNIANFKSQLEKIGFDYDWSREINTTDPDYYKWTQWIFLKLFEKGLAYQSDEPINWCPSCMTGLANEDLDGDLCERCGTKVEKKRLPQWVLKITAYADRMLTDLDGLKWPEHIKEAQRNWIGRSEGLEFTSPVKDTNLTIKTFSAHFEAFFADTFVVIAPDHPFLPTLLEGVPNAAAILKEAGEMAAKRAAQGYEAPKEPEGIFTGRYTIDPVGNGELPIWIANYALAEYGTGIVKCSAHDERDFAFAKKYNIKLKAVLLPQELELQEKVKRFEICYADMKHGTLTEPREFEGVVAGKNRQRIADFAVEKNFAVKRVTYKIKDWVFSRQRYWGEPIPIIHCRKDGAVAVPEKDLPVKLPQVERYEPSGTGESPLANIAEWVNTTCPKCGGEATRETNTMPQWAGSSWYYLRFMDPHNTDALVGKEKEKYWAPVDVYVGGDHAVRHLIYARFWHKFLYDLGAVSTAEPFARLEFLGFILAEDGRKMSKRYGNVINPDDVVARFGADTFRLYEMFMGPFENTTAWSTNSIVGVARFVERLWRLAQKPLTEESAWAELESVVHFTAKKVTEDIEAFKFNTAVSQLMICLNAMEKAPALRAGQWKAFTRLLAPFAPHLAEELWERLGEEFSIHRAPWPQYDPAKLVSEKVTVAVQINGKLRGSVEIGPNATEAEALAAARADEKVAKWLMAGQEKKAVYVPGRVINFVIDKV
jgi:leucyl-tRNA synthetase